MRRMDLATERQGCAFNPVGKSSVTQAGVCQRIYFENMTDYRRWLIGVKGNNRPLSIYEHVSCDVESVCMWLERNLRAEKKRKLERDKQNELLPVCVLVKTADLKGLKNLQVEERN